jgi:5-(carboxyamino)imidazole ribonucleotide synthase
MLAMAAARLGYRCHIYAPDKAPPAADVSAAFTRGAWDDEDKLAAFGRQVDVATYEFENIAAGPLAALAAQAPLFPPCRALEIAQDRLAEKKFIETLGGRPAPYAQVDDREALDRALNQIGTPSILKTRLFGYDGKGQARTMNRDEAGSAWEIVGGALCVLEAFIPFEAEFSILLCRGADGEMLTWPTPENRHRDGMLDTSVLPAGEAVRRVAGEAEALARKAANALGHVGMLTLEYFATPEGALFNEMAPRVHNSGHWTVEGSITSQFENHVRAICGLPLGATGLTGSRIEMRNLIGGGASEWPDILADDEAHLHLYGKAEARPGRKMGHVTRVWR